MELLFSICLQTLRHLHSLMCSALFISNCFVFCLIVCGYVYFADSVFETSMDSGGCAAVFPEALDCCVWEHYQEKSTELCGDAQQLSVLG